MLTKIFHLSIIFISLCFFVLSCKLRSSQTNENIIKTTQQNYSRVFDISKFKWVQEPQSDVFQDPKILIIVLRPRLVPLSNDVTLEQLKTNPEMIKIKAQCFIDNLKAKWEKFLETHPQMQCVANEIYNLVVNVDKEQKNNSTNYNILNTISNFVFIVDASSITDQLMELNDIKKRNFVVKASVKALTINKIFNELKQINDKLKNVLPQTLSLKVFFAVDPYGQGIKDRQNSLITIDEDISKYTLLVFALIHNDILPLFPKLPGVLIVDNLQKFFFPFLKTLDAGNLAH